ncbi:MAG: DUF4838 domain-containing protein [Spirochaetes bacterium]|nr:DUF4838 domain-containing protein [Spirochaetota bacterium]
MSKLTILFVPFLNVLFAANLLPLAQKGASDYVVSVASNASPSESFAAEELAKYLRQITRAPFPIATESPAAASIQVGPTSLALKNGIDARTYAPEEWSMKISGKTLFLAGGRPRGTLYAVYEFLEREGGVRWLDAETEFVPRRPDLAVAPKEGRARPAFSTRYIATAWYRQKPTSNQNERTLVFSLRNKGNGLAPADPKYGFAERYGSPTAVHTFGNYIPPKEYFDAHPEYFSMGPDGKREGKGITQNLGWQLCLSRPELRDLILKKLKAHIAADRASCAKTGAPFPRVYVLDQNDGSPDHICLCPECQRITKREGSAAGLMVDFINEIAAGIEGPYPDVLLQTFAYECSEIPPKTIRPRDNVVIRYADFYTTSDLFRPLAHPVNRYSYELLTGWSRLSKNLAVWDYWKMFEQTTPYSHLAVVRADLLLFLENRVKILFAECEDYTRPATGDKDIQSLYALKIWVFYKLMQDPSLPLEPLVRCFCEGYYGSAAATLYRFWDFLEKATLDTDGDKAVSIRPGKAQYSLPSERRYLNLAFYREANRLLDQALKESEGDRAATLRIRRERLPFDESLLQFWNEFSAKLPPGASMPWERSAILARNTNDWLAWSAAAYSPEFQAMVQEQVRMNSAVGEGLPLPAPFKELPRDRVFDVTWHQLRQGRALLQADTDAAGGKALVLSGDPASHQKTLAFGLYNTETKTFGLSRALDPASLPKDEKFHLYKIGLTTVSPGTVVWVHWTWFIQQPIDGACDPSDPGQLWTCYASLKACGPAYVAGSTRENAVSLDRLILVKSERKKTGKEDAQALAAFDEGNLIRNGGLESGAGLPAHWRLLGAAVAEEDFNLEETGGKIGARCLSIGGGPKEMTFKQDGLKLTPGKRYRFSGWVKPEGFAGKWMLRIVDTGWTKSMAQLDLLPGAKTPAEGAWTRLEETFTAGEVATGYSAVLLVGAGARGKICFDGIQLLPVAD